MIFMRGARVSPAAQKFSIVSDPAFVGLQLVVAASSAGFEGLVVRFFQPFIDGRFAGLGDLRRAEVERQLVDLLAGAVLNFTPLDPIKALFWSAVINGVAAAPIMAMIMLMASKNAVMGQFTLRPFLKTLGWLATAAMAAAAIGMFATWGK